MSDLVAICFPNEQKAEEIRERVLKLQSEYLISLEDAVVAVKRPDGQIKLNQMINPLAVSTASGTMWGALIGLIFMMPLAGAAIGAASGAIGGALTDLGINDTFMKEVAASIQPGEAVLFLLIRNMTADKVMDDLRGVGGKILRTSFDHEKEAILAAALAGATTAVPPPAS
jgi:uncharacterized membrane protein